MSAVTPIHPARGVEPAKINAALALSLANLLNAIGGGGSGQVIPANAAPAPAVRVALEARLAVVERAMASISPTDCEQELLSLFLVMKSQGGTVDERRAILRVYAATLGSLPHFAVARACASVRSREHGGDGWMPDPGFIRQVAERYLAPLRKELRDIKAVLEARIGKATATPEGRARAAAIAREVCTELAMARPIGERPTADALPRRPTPATLEELAERLKREPLTPLSEETRAKVVARWIEPGSKEEAPLAEMRG